MTMLTDVPKRTDPRRETTHLHLIDVAEHLFGEHGLKGVSLREIAAAAGAGNNSAVSYHFGSKENLIKAIFEHRLSALEPKRERALAELKAAGKQHDITALVDAIYRPIAEQRNSNGRRSYAAFISGLLRLNEFSVRLDQTLGPAGEEMASLLRGALPVPNIEAAYRRHRLATLFICDSLMVIDSSDLSKQDGQDVAVSDLFAMATAALSSPFKGGG